MPRASPTTAWRRASASKRVRSQPSISFARSKSRSSRYACSAATPAAIARGCPLNVCPLGSAWSSKYAASDSRTATPPSGTYADVTPLAKVMMSGVTPNRCAANAAPVRPNPVITSSKTSRMPWRSQSSRTRGEVALGVDDDAVAAHDGLDEQRGDLVAAFVRHDLVEVRDRARCFLTRIARVERTAIRKRREEAHDAGNARFVRPPAVLAGERARARRRAVEGTVRRENFVPAAQHARELHRVFVRFAAARRKEDAPALGPRRQLDDRVSELLRDGRWRSVGAAYVKRCACSAIAAATARMAVAEIHRDEPGREVEIPRAAVVVEIGAFAAHDDGRPPPALRDPRREDVACVKGRNVVGRRAHFTIPETTIRPPATLSAKKTMKIHTPSRLRNSRCARAERVVWVEGRFT